jgi:ATP-dependent DNA helicase RecQ
LLYEPRDIDLLQEQIKIRFPPEEKIKEIYLAIANYLQLPMGSGEGIMYDFDLDDFVKKFGFDVLLTMNVLRILSQEELLSYSEALLMPSLLGFTANRDELLDCERAYPHLEPLIKTLLRTYRGIFDQPVFIQEKKLAYILREKPEVVKQHLQQLHRLQIADYRPQKERPQLQYLKERLEGSQFSMNKKNYEARKQVYIERLEKMIAYLKAESGCRSTYLSAYFGDSNAQSCGICDHCLAEKKKSQPKDPDALLRQIILEKLLPGPIAADEIKSWSNSTQSPQQIMKLLEEMVTEEEIFIDEAGYVRLRKK